MSVDPRPRTRLGDIVFEFEHPLLDKSSSGTKIEHTILPTSPEDDQSTVIQPFGTEAASMTMRGDCYRDEANALDELIGEVVELRHARHSGDVYVDDVSTEPQSVEDNNGRRYTYNATLVEVQ